MKANSVNFRLVLVCSLGLFGPFSSCSSPEGPAGDVADSGFNFGKDAQDGQSPADLPDTQEQDGITEIGQDAGSDLDVPFNPDVEQEDVVEQVDEPDEVTPPDLDALDQQKDTDPPFNFPYATFGPMTLSAKGILIDAKYVQMRMAEVSYWKVAREDWEGVLDSVKEAGFNGIYTSACWRLHERKAGVRDFTTGNLALGDFLDMAETRGLYVYFAAGPWVSGEAGGCLPEWMLTAGAANPSPVADGKFAVRTTDTDYTAAVTAWFDELNAIVSKHQITLSPLGRVVFYQVEADYDVFYFLRDAAGRVLQEMAGVIPVPINPGAYMAWLRDTVQADGISVPLLTSLSGDFENGGRRLLGTGDTPGVLPALDLGTYTEYEAMEGKIWALRKEMRNSNLHGQVYGVTPGIVVGLMPSATHMARALMAGADVAVVRDFSAGLLPGPFAGVAMDASGIEVVSSLDDAKVAMGSQVRDLASPLAQSGIPRKTYFAFRRLNRLMERLGPGSGFAGKDMPNRTGPNAWSGSPVKISTTNAAVGAIEGKYTAPATGPAGGILEVMGDHFAEWYQAPVEPVDRANYYFDSTDGTILLNLVNLDGLKNGKNKHDREDQITKVLVSGITMPRHSNIVVPASDDEATGDSFLGWGSKLMLLNHPLGPGYPWMEYCSANLMAAREFSGAMLILVHGKPQVKAEGIYFTEAGEISFQNIGGIPDIMHNSLPGGGIHTDPGGKLAVTFQHDSTGYLKLGLPSGKQILLMVTTTGLAETAFFGPALDGSDVAVLGMDRVDSAAGLPETLSVKGKVSARSDRVVLLVSKEPKSVKVNGEPVSCTWNPHARSVECPLAPPEPLPETIPHTQIYTRSETFNGNLGDIGVADYPDKFANTDGAPLPLGAAEVAADFGVAWYVAQIDLPTVAAGQDGFLSLGGAADIVSLFVNATYVGSSTSAGNPPMSSVDVASGLASVGFRIPAGVLVQGMNTIGVRVLALGHSPESIPLFYSAAPILPPELDAFTSLLPHFAVEGLKPDTPKGVWGSAKLTSGALALPVPGPWTISRGDASGMAQSYGTLHQWHEMSPAPSTPGQYGFSTTSDFSPEAPFMLPDGQVSWVTTTFSSGDMAHRGSLELELEGRSAVGLVFLNGKLVGTWFSDDESLSQGLHSRLLQGAGSRQLLADRSYGVHSPGDPDRVTLPARLINKSGGQDNRVTVMVIDISPPFLADLALPVVGKVTGQGRLTRLAITWNRD